MRKYNYMLILLLPAVSAMADLEWKQKEVALKVQPTQTETQAVFDFVNAGDAPITIENVSITCGCLSTKLAKNEYAPGEKGQLTIALNLNGRTGPQQKQVMVDTSDGKTVDLLIKTDIPEAYTIDSRLVLWKKGDDAEKKTIRLRNPNKKPIKLLSISSSNPDVPATMKTIKEGFEYEVTVTHKASEEQLRSVIQIATEPPAGMKDSKTISLYVVVM